MQLLLSTSDFLANWLPTYYLLFLLCIALLFSMFRREFIYQQGCWLSDRIEKTKAQLKGKAKSIPLRRSFLGIFSQLYYPTSSTFFLLILALSLIFGLTTKHFWIKYEDAGFYTSLVPVQIGIVALIFPIMIFIIGFSGNRMASGVNISEVLLRESYLFPVGVTGLFFIVNLIWARSSYVVVAQIIVSALMYAWILFRIVQVLLNDQRLLEKSKALLRDKLRRSIECAIDRRIGTNVLFEELGENKIELQYAFMNPEKRGIEHYRVDLKRSGTLIDVNLVILRRIATLIEQASRRNGISFYKNSPNLSGLPNQNSSMGVPNSEEASAFKENKERYLRIRYMETMPEEDKCVLSFEKDLIKEKIVLDEIRGLATKTFKIKNIDDNSNSLRKELRNLKDQFIEDIRNRRLGRIDSLREVYLSLAELFLDTMKSYSSSFTMEAARKEQSSIVEEWVEVEWLTSDVRDIYETAIETHDKNIIREIGYLPIAIAHRAIRTLDHYIFQKSLRFLGLFYMHALRERDENLSRFMKERSGVYLKETADYYVQYELEKIDLGEDRVKQYRDYAIEIFLQLQSLIKQAYDAKDLESFNKFISIGQKLFKHFHPADQHPSAEDLKWQLNIPNIAQDEKDRTEKKLKQAEFLESIERDIQFKKEEMFFGLGGFILSELHQDKQNAELLKFFRSISSSLPSSIKELTTIFLRCHNFDIEHFWGWEWWDFPLDEEVHAIDFMGKIVFLYCVKSLEAINGMNVATIEKVDLPYNRDLIHKIEKDDSDVRKTITNLLNDAAQWNGLIPNVEAQKKNALFKAFDLAKEKQDRDEDDFLINAKLSLSKLSEFTDGFLKDYRNNCGIHAVFEKYGNFKDVTKIEYQGSQKSFGYNRLDEKGAFVEGWYVDYSRWGEQYGSGMATSENTDLFDQLCKPLSPLTVSKQDLINQIEIAIDDLVSKNCSPNVIITSLEFDDYGLIASDGRFIPHWHKDCPKKSTPNFQGVLKIKHVEYPVIRLYREKKKGLVGIFDLKKYASLLQLDPTDNKSEERYSQFYIHVSDLNTDDKVRNDIISAAPEWLNKYPDKDRYLRTKVVVKTFMRQELQILDVSAGKLIQINENDASQSL